MGIIKSGYFNGNLPLSYKIFILIIISPTYWLGIIDINTLYIVPMIYPTVTFLIYLAVNFYAYVLKVIN